MENYTERITPTKENLNDFLNIYVDHKKRYEFALNYIKDKDVADIACGVGYGTFIMAKVSKKIHGFDISEKALNHAKKHFKLFNNNFYHVDELIKFRYNVIVSFETIEHMNEVEGDVFLSKIRKSLVKDGLLIISTPINKFTKKENVTPYHIREYSDIEFPEKLKRNGFEILDMYGQGGRYHEILYGKTENSKFSLFTILKSGVHKIIPKKIRRVILIRLSLLFLGNPRETMEITKENWRNKAFQIAVCRRLY